MTPRIVLIHPNIDAVTQTTLKAPIPEKILITC
jgi:hypothetical protein